MSALASPKSLSLYRSCLRESRKFTNYNFREYFIRRTRDAFKENQKLTDPTLIHDQLIRAEKDLAVLKRQSVISQMYTFEKLVVEYPGHHDHRKNESN